MTEPMNANMTDFAESTMTVAASASTTATAAAAAACEACGWAAAFMSMLAFGSFGVPIKSRAAVSLDIDPLVMQSYKTAMCFLTSWLVLLNPNTTFTYTPWGIVSGLFWVPGGVATVYAVKKAGLAIGIGIGSSFIVLVSFIWGIMIFEEKVHSRWGASFAIMCMMMGLFGMSYFSSPESATSSSSSTIVAAAADTNDGEVAAVMSSTTTEESEISLHERRAKVETAAAAAAESTSSRSSSKVAYAKVNRSESSSSNAQDTNDVVDDGDGHHGVDDDDRAILPVSADVKADNSELHLTERTQRTSSSDETFQDEHDYEGDEDDVLAQRRLDIDNENDDASHHHLHDPPPHHLLRLCCCGISLTERQCGMLAAVFNGTWGGSILVPMKWCKGDTKGVEYLISFAIGASLITLGLWVMRFSYHYHQLQSVKAAYQQLPSFHFRILWMAGGTCGLLWSIGNFFSLISVYYLGEGVGYPLVQTAILVSGLWGIFYFKEVQGVERISKWFLSSLLTVFGILLLGYEHHEE